MCRVRDISPLDARGAPSGSVSTYSEPCNEFVPYRSYNPLLFFSS